MKETERARQNESMMCAVDSHLIDGNSPLVLVPVLSPAQALSHLGVKHAHLQRRNPSRSARTCVTQRRRRKFGGSRFSVSIDCEPPSIRVWCRYAGKCHARRASAPPLTHAEIIAPVSTSRRITCFGGVAALFFERGAAGKAGTDGRREDGREGDLFWRCSEIRGGAQHSSDQRR